MTGVAVVAVAVFWTGATLVLGERRWFTRRALVDRLRPYEPGGMAAGGPATGAFSVDSFAAVLSPVARRAGDRIARLAGIDDDLTVRLERIHSTLDPGAFRMRQCGRAAWGGLVGIVVSTVVATPAPVTLLFVLGGPALGFLLVEQQLSAAAERRSRRLRLELPVVAEQLGTLLSAGFSLGSALQRLARRGQGASGEDLRRVVARVRQGMSEADALHEWADLARLDALERLVTVLALDRDTGDLGRLVADEARTIRREVQRDLIEQMERRSQQVWIPVTVAALVPGSIFIAIPFLDALRAFGAA